MASITTRQTGTTGVNGVTRKDLPLTNAEIDTNFINLNDNKLEKSNNLSDLTNVATARTNLGFGSIAVQNSNSVSITGGSISGITDLAIADGGTGVSTAPTNGQLLIGKGGTYVVANLTGTANQISITNGSGSITLATPQDLATSSNVQFGSIGIGTAASGTAGELVATGDITAWYSDERLKTNIQLIDNALEKVSQLRGVTFNANQLAESFGYSSKESQVGVIAQDVQRILPEAVKPAPFDTLHLKEGVVSKSGDHYLTVQYDKLVPLLVEAIKQLNEEVKSLREVTPVDKEETEQQTLAADLVLSSSDTQFNKEI